MNLPSDAELAQMERDGRGRPSVIKQLAAEERTRRALAANPTPDSVLMRGRWVHYLTSSCTHGKPPEFLRIVNLDGSETEVALK